MEKIKNIRDPWGGEMTSKERFLRQMNFKSVDRTVNMEFGYWDENFTLWKMFADNDITNNAQADIFFSFDPMPIVGGKLWMSPDFEEKEISRDSRHKIIQNKDGLLAEVPLDSSYSTIPHFMKSSVVTPDDWKRVKQEHFAINIPERDVDISAIKSKHKPDRDYPLGVDFGSMIGKVRDMLTFEGICFAIMDYPDMVEDMVETACLLSEHFLDQVLPHFKFDFAAGWEDICYNMGPIVPPWFFEKVVVPRYKRITKRLRDNGISLIYTDCDGDVRPILEMLMDGGINCLFPYEVNSCAHPGELLDMYPGALRIMGGFDKMQMGYGKEAIKKYMDSIVPYVERGGYIPFCDHRCPPNVTEEDYLYYLDLKREMLGHGY
jgi:uroporphyrinogen decarboxylase